MTTRTVTTYKHISPVTCTIDHAHYTPIHNICIPNVPHLHDVLPLHRRPLYHLGVRHRCVALSAAGGAFLFDLTGRRGDGGLKEVQREKGEGGRREERRKKGYGKEGRERVTGDGEYIRSQ